MLIIMPAYIISWGLIIGIIVIEESKFGCIEHNIVGRLKRIAGKKIGRKRKLGGKKAK